MISQWIGDQLTYLFPSSELLTVHVNYIQEIRCVFPVCSTQLVIACTEGTIRRTDKFSTR